MKLIDKVVVITGGGSGIGRKITKDFISEGAIVVILDRNKTTLKKLAKEINNDNKLITYQCDISKSKIVKEVFKDIRNKIGNIYGLVNNAGINPSRNNILETLIEDWNTTIDVNLSGAFNCSKAAIPQMIEIGCGSIVNVASIAGITAMEKRFSYSVSKSGLIGLSASMAIDFAKNNIRVNCVCPGYVETPLVAEHINELSSKDKNNLVNAHLLGRLGKPQDIANAVKFLISEDASWITGIVLPVDGGYTAGKTY